MGYCWRGILLFYRRLPSAGYDSLDIGIIIGVKLFFWFLGSLEHTPYPVEILASIALAAIVFFWVREEELWMRIVFPLIAFLLILSALNYFNPVGNYYGNPQRQYNQLDTKEHKTEEPSQEKGGWID